MTRLPIDQDETAELIQKTWDSWLANTESGWPSGRPEMSLWAWRSAFYPPPYGTQDDRPAQGNIVRFRREIGYHEPDDSALQVERVLGKLEDVEVVVYEQPITWGAS